MARSRALLFRTNNILIPLGCDFNFQNALMKYKNMDRIIDYINANSDKVCAFHVSFRSERSACLAHTAAFAVQLNARAQYSTLDDYFKAIYQSGLSVSCHPSNPPPQSFVTNLNHHHAHRNPSECQSID